MTTDKAVPVLYLDIDGTVREGKDDALGRFVNGPEDVRVFPQAVELMRAWAARGGRIVGVSNQGGIALGIVTLDLVAQSMAETQVQCDWLFDRIAFCRHHPSASDPLMARCWCRKPRPGLAIEAALSMAEQFEGEIYPPHLALMVGDRQEDLQMAGQLNVAFEWAEDWRSGQPAWSVVGPSTTTVVTP